jgi:hypothetical protein
MLANLFVIMVWFIVAVFAAGLVGLFIETGRGE